eukprot:6953502-Ditylum_brightwellii.AAC.1
MLKNDKEHDVKRQLPEKASDITKSQNVLVQNDSENKSQMHTNAQLEDHIASDVNRHSLGKTFGTPKCQNAPMKVTCSSKRNPPKNLSTICLCSQKLTVPSVKEDQSCTSSTPLAPNRNIIEEQ